MAAARHKPPFRGAALLLLLAAAGCVEDGGGGSPPTAAPPGFSADTFTRAGLASGATATEAGCRALPDGLWVGTGKGRRECLRHAAAGTEGAAGRTALVYVPGDPEGVSYRSAGGRPLVDAASEHYETSPETRRAAAEALSAAMGGRPVVLLARPGMHGSSGDHARDRHTPEEVELIDDALTRLRRRYALRDLALVGFSSGGAVVAHLLARRTDVRCAVMASAPLDMAEFHRRQDGAIPDHYAMRGDLADPMRTVSAVRPGAAAFVLGDRRDRSVPASAWDAWVAAARRAGLRVHAAEVDGLDRPELGGGESRHLTTARGMEVAHACAEGAPAERILHALRSDEPLLAPRGRRLGAGEIGAAVAGRSLRGNEWHPRVDVSSFWGPDGELLYLDLRRGERRIAELRWRVEGDRLCTTRHGCGEVLSDGRALHVVKGEPARLAVTLLGDGPGAPAPAAAAPAPAPTPAPAAGAVRLLVGFGLGSNTDWIARVVAEALRERLGRPVVVENLPGRAGANAAEALARAAPDGGTLGLFSPSLLTARHASPRGMAIDPLADLAPLGLVATSPNVVLVAPGHPARDLAGLAAALRAAPDTPCATADKGSFLHLSGALLMQALGTACRFVHHADPNRALADLAEGRVQVYVNNALTGMPPAREGRAKALAVTSRERLAAAPELPTVRETVPGFEAVAWFVLLGPRGLPAGVAARLERAVQQAARDPTEARRLRVLGAEPIGSSAAELAALLRAEDAKWAGAARAAGLAAE